MTRRFALLLALLATACDPIPGPDTDTDVATSDTAEAPTTSGADPEPVSTGGDVPGYICEDVGRACDLDAPDCGPGLDCVARPDLPSKGVCAHRCHPDTLPCAVGWCDQKVLSLDGICRDPDGLPIGLCEGAPSCTGDSCKDGECGNGLSCLWGACALACETSADCGEGQVCKVGACFDGDVLADPC